jgi:hypothetical protein
MQQITSWNSYIYLNFTECDCHLRRHHQVCFCCICNVLYPIRCAAIVSATYWIPSGVLLLYLRRTLSHQVCCYCICDVLYPIRCAAIVSATYCIPSGVLLLYLRRTLSHQVCCYCICDVLYPIRRWWLAVRLDCCSREGYWIYWENSGTKFYVDFFKTVQM